MPEVVVDLDTCVGHGRCYAVSPELFEPFDDEGRPRVKLAPLPEELIEAAERAVAACPEEAISLIAVDDTAAS